MRYVRVNGVNLSVSERSQDGEKGGEEQTVLLLAHGFPFNRHLWQAQLRGVFPGVHMVAPDLRGAGNSEVPDGPYSIDDYAEDLSALLNYLHVPRAVVAGMSMGGYIALALWRLHPEQVQALVLMDTRAEPDTAEGKANRDTAIARIQQQGAAAYAREMLPRLLAPENRNRQPLAGQVELLMSVQPAPGMMAALQAIRDRPDSRPTLPTITVPALVLVGEGDQLTPPAVAASMADAIPNARLVTIPHAGHVSPLENSRAVNAALRDFISATERGA